MSGKTKSHPKHPQRKWSHHVKTDSTHPPEGLFKKDAKTVARIMATREVSPGGLGSAIRMVQFYINRAGNNLDSKQKTELEQAKHILQEQYAAQKQQD